MPNKLIRHYGRGHLHFITFTCYRRLALNFAGAEDCLPRFWQRRFYDFNVWSLKKRVEKLHYMHMNPLKNKLVRHPKNWPWSSFSSYVRPGLGLIPVDPVR